MKITAITFLVDDLDRAISFFCKAFECKEIWRTDQPGEIFTTLYKLSNHKMSLVHLSLGDEYIYILHLKATHIKSYPFHIQGNNLAFQHIAIVVSDMEKAYQHLLQCEIQAISKSPQTIPEWNKAAAGIQAFYFRSPIGYPLELIYFPPGKGNAPLAKINKENFPGN